MSSYLVNGLDGVVRPPADDEPLTKSAISFQQNLTNYFLGGMHSDK